MATTLSSITLCGEEDCGRPEYTDGLCSMHYQRLRKYHRLHLIVHRLPAECEINGCNAKPRNRFGERAMCNMHGMRWRKHGSSELPPRKGRPPRAKCTVDGCRDPVRSGYAIYCEMHYGRMRRNGNLKGRTIAPPRLNDDGYLVRCCKGHPLASKNGQLYVHREVLFAAIGPGKHACHWCGQEIEWNASGKRRLVVDHLDADKANNCLTNLKQSCHSCNSRRGAFQSWVMLHRDDPFLWELYEAARTEAKKEAA